MANNQRRVYGPPEFVMAEVASATVIEVGDLLAWDAVNHQVYPADDETWDTNEATTQDNFGDTFAGVAMDASANGDTDNIRVMINGTCRFVSTSADYELDTAVCPEKDTGNNLLNQTVQITTSTNASVGRSVEVAASGTSLAVHIRSKVFGAWSTYGIS